MLRVKTKLKMSDTHGIGLFAAEPIAKGTVTWKYDQEFDTSYTLDEVKKMPAAAQDIFWHYAYHDKETDRYVLCADDQRFINHTNGEPTIISTPNEDIAAKDLSVGDELLCNYDGFESGYFDRRNIDVTKFS